MTLTADITKEAKREGLTAVQRSALLAIRKHHFAHEISPTYSEVGDALGFGKSAARVLVNTLRRKGLLASAPGRYRNIIVTSTGHSEAYRAEQEAA